MSICIVSVIREPFEVIKKYVAYHRNIGIQNFIIYVDGDDDGLITDYLIKISGVRAFNCNRQFLESIGIRPETAFLHRQHALADHALAISRDVGFDWLIHIDVDELIYFTGSKLEKILVDTGAEVVRFNLLEAVPDSPENANMYEAKYFRTRPFSNKRKMLAWCLTMGRPFFRYSHFRGHQQSKTAVHVTQNIKRLRIHFPEQFKWTPIFESDNISLLHFVSMSTERWIRKWSLRIDDILLHRFLEVEQAQGKIVWKIANKKPARKQRAFRRVFMFGPYSHWILLKLNLIVRIDIPEESFRFKKEWLTS